MASNRLPLKTITSTDGKAYVITRHYGRFLNNRARALIDDTLTRLIEGDWKDRRGSHGKGFRERLAEEILENPLATLQWINDHTPCDEGTVKTGDNPLITNNINHLYLTAMQRANEIQAEPKQPESW